LTGNAKRSREEIARTKVIKVIHPTYFPDSALTNFFLFGCLKGEMADFTVNSPADILSEICWIFQENSKEILVAVYDEWIRRLEWITEHYHTK
jgi:hypothetical protein